MADKSEGKQPVVVSPDSGWPEIKHPKVAQPKEPIIAPDGHVTLSQEDIDARV